MKRYQTICRETGTFIDEFDTIDQAKQEIESYEKEDVENGWYEPEFYEIYDAELEQIVY